MKQRWISFLLAISILLGSVYGVMPIQAAADASAQGTLSSAGSKIRDKAKDIKSGAQEKSKNIADAATKKASELSRTASNIANKALPNLSDQAEKASKNITKTAQKAKNAASKGLATAGAALAEASSKIDDKKIADGWKFTGKLSGTKLAAELGSKKYTDYIDGISNAIEDMRKDLNESANNNRGAAQEKGFVFEKWHTDTYNIDAAAKESKNMAKQLEENSLGSVDVQIKNGKGEAIDNASMKALKNSKESAKAQASEILSDGYWEYAATAKAKGEKYSLADYVNQLPEKEANAVIRAEYDGQKRIIPADQVDNAKMYIEGRIEKLDVPSNYTEQQKKVYQDTLDSLRDHVESTDGVKSKPLTSKELQALTEASKDGNVDLEKYGITVSNYVSRSVLVKQVMSAGLSAAALQTAIEVGPDLYTVIKEALQGGHIDEKKLKKLGLNATLAGAGGFTEGALSQEILIACKAGKLGNNMKNISPNSVGTIAVLTIDAAKYAYMLSKNQITANDYADAMAEETFVAIASQASGAAVQAMLPMVPFAYVAGSMAGGMLASAGYQVGKTMILEIKNEGGVMAVLPERITKGYNMGSDLLKELDIKKNKVKGVLSHNFTISTADKGKKIKLIQAA